MKRILACTAVLACLALASLVLVLRGSGSSAPAGSKEPSAKATLSSRSILFGDTVDARLDLVVPRGLAASAFRGRPDFRPFQIVSSHVDRADLGGGLERISLTYGLTCLSPQCESGGRFTRVHFTPTIVSIPGRSLRAVWPRLVQVSRLRDVTTPVTDGLDSGPVAVPGLQPRLDTQEALGAAAASLLVLLAAGLVIRHRVRRRLALAAQRGTLLQALLARVEAGLPEDVIYRQRHALDALAVELRHLRINGSLAIHAERLAWAPEQPNPAEIRALCTEIRQLVKA